MAVATHLPPIRLQLAKDQKTILVTFPYDPRLVNFIKTVAGRRWDKDNKRWKVPAYGYREMRLAAAKVNIQLLLSPALKAAVVAGEKARTTLETAREAEDAELILDTPTTPYPFQRAGIQYLLHALDNFHGCLLADDMGLGKTFQALAVVALRPDFKQVLVLCPNSLKYNWAAEVEKHFPQLSVQVIDGGPAQRREAWASDARIIISNYDLLIRDPEPLLRRWDLLIADEATALKNYKAQRTKKAKKIERRKTMALSGMPLENRLTELHSIMDLVMPGLLGTGWQFIQRHVVRDRWGATIGYRGLDVVRDRIRPHYLRRLKKDVLEDLPAKVYNDVWLELGHREWRLYDSLVRQIKEAVEANPKLGVQNVLTMFLRLKQLTSCASLLDSDCTEETKMQALRDLLEASEEKVVVFTEFAELAQKIADEFDAPLIAGKVPAALRAERISSYQKDASQQLLVSTDAGAYGLTITAASIIVHMDQPWNPARARQREDRLHRIGQQNSVQVVNLLTLRTIDGRIRTMMSEKLKLAGAVLEEDTLTPENRVTKQDLLAMLGGSKGNEDD